MSYVLSKIKTRLQTLPLRYLYNPKDEGGRGRFTMLMSGIMSGLIGQLSGGLFYTSFLLQYGLDKSKIGILTFVPYFACLLQIFSPWILERFPKRKWLLFAVRMFSYTVNILGITILPMLIKDPKALIVGFVALTILHSSINSLFASGYSAWHANFLPEHVRVDYFNTTSCINSFITFLVTLIVSAIGDKMTGTEHELLMLTIIRFIAFALAIIDCLILLLPKEYPYATVAKAKLSNVFTLPFKEKRFLLTILICAGYSFATNLPNATLNAYILQDVGVSYTLCNGINATYFLFFIFFSSMWKKLISKLYWFRALTVVVLIHAATFFMYSFVTADTLWLYITVRFSQHVLGVATGTIFSSLPYVHLPEADRTNYLTFHSIVANIAVFLSLMLGTVFTTFFSNRYGDSGSISFLAYSFSSTQLLLFASGAAQVAIALISLALSRRLTPPELLPAKNRKKV